MIGRPSIHARRIAAASLLLAALQPGCTKPLLAPDEQRSQYDRYDAVRGQYASQYTEDPFGHKRPNLRARLTPKD